MSVFFNGQLLVTPTTASVVNDDAMQNQNLTVGNAIAYVGKSTGGTPKTVLRFGSPQEAKDVLRSGELLTAVLKGFSPSAETGAPSVINAIRINPALQSALVLSDASPSAVINLKSVNYGLTDNQIKLKIESGTLAGKKVTVQSEASGLSAYSDNVGLSAFNIVYTGAEETATITVTGTTAVIHAPAATVLETIDLSVFKTVGSLVDKINTLAGFSATVLSGSENKPALNGLDFITAQDCKTAAYVVRADLQAIVDWFNLYAGNIVIATRAENAGTLPANIPFTYLSGGTEGTTTNTDWSDALTALQTEDVQWVSAITGDEAVHSMVDAHVNFCSTILRRERRAVSGLAAASSDTVAIASAKTLNSPRSSLVHIGYYDNDPVTGALTLMPPYMTAALIAAMFAGSNPGTPLTNKTMSVKGLERKLRNPTDTDPLILGGVLCVEDTQEGFKVVQSISTWRGNNKYNLVEQSTGAALDFTVRNVRQAVDVLRGQKGNPLLLSRAISITDSTLKELARSEPEGPGVLAGDAENPAYRNISASLEGDVTRIEFECSPVVPSNYVLVTVYAKPYSGAAAS
jgi:hypothetical protein